jgi:hypothetical protein
MPRHAIHHRTIDRVRAEPSTLDCTMTPGDIAAVLRDLRFERGHAATVRLDRDVRLFGPRRGSASRAHAVTASIRLDSVGAASY